MTTAKATGPYYRQLTEPSTSSLAAPKLSPYLRSEQRDRTISRPKSMLELGDLYALQAAKDLEQRALTQSHYAPQTPQLQVRSEGHTLFKQELPASPAELASEKCVEAGSNDSSSAPIQPREDLPSTQSKPRRKIGDLKRLILPSQQPAKLATHASLGDMRHLARQPLDQAKSIARSRTSSSVKLEAERAEGHGRLLMYLELEATTLVEGDLVRGRISFVRRRTREPEEPVWVAPPALRFVGYEEEFATNERYTFMQHVETIPHHAIAEEAVSTDDFRLFQKDASSTDFQVRLPISIGARGPWTGRAGAIKYQAIA